MKQLLLVLFCLAITPVQARGADCLWQDYLKEADQAFRDHNYIRARLMFSASVKEAKKVNQHLELVEKMEVIADGYAHEKRYKVASAIHRRALNLYEKARGSNDLGIVAIIRKYVPILRKINKDKDATNLELRARTIVVSRRDELRQSKPKS
jgi:hypothetical protein